MDRILVAVDRADNASEVVAYAVELARSAGGKVRLFHSVVIPPPVPVPGVLAPGAFDGETLYGVTAEWLERLAREVPEGLRDGAVADVGPVVRRLRAEVRSYAPDLVVIGAHAHGPIARVLGSTAARIVNRIDRPVLVVRPLRPRAPASDGAGTGSREEPRRSDRA
jgi:nucleotide-binding universal stress UspA family protein